MTDPKEHEWQWKQLVEMAIINLERPQIGRPLWATVGLTFGLGTTLARLLCERFGFDPDAPTGEHLVGDDDE